MLEALKKSSSRSLAETYHDIEKLCVDVKIRFISGVGFSQEKEYHLVIGRNKPCHVHFDCLNRDCTGSGFDLDGEIMEAVNKRSVQSGTKMCDGKEDWKYLKATGYSCQTVLSYTITPYFLASVHDNG